MHPSRGLSDEDLTRYIAWITADGSVKSASTGSDYISPGASGACTATWAPPGPTSQTAPWSQTSSTAHAGFSQPPRAPPNSSPSQLKCCAASGRSSTWGTAQTCAYRQRSPRGFYGLLRKANLAAPPWAAGAHAWARPIGCPARPARDALGRPRTGDHLQKKVRISRGPQFPRSASARCATSAYTPPVKTGAGRAKQLLWQPVDRGDRRVVPTTARPLPAWGPAATHPPHTTICAASGPACRAPRAAGSHAWAQPLGGPAGPPRGALGRPRTGNHLQKVRISRGPQFPALLRAVPRPRVHPSRGLSDEDLARYIAWITADGAVKSSSTVSNYISMGVRRLHRDLGLPWPRLSGRPLVANVLQGTRRLLKATTGTAQKLPVTVEMLRRFRPLLNLGDSADLCIWTALLTGFYGLLRKANLAAPTAGKRARRRPTRRSAPRASSAAPALRRATAACG